MSRKKKDKYGIRRSLKNLRRRQKKQKTAAITRAGVNREQLKDELSDPKRMEKHLKRLNVLFKTNQSLQILRLPREPLLKIFDEVAEEQELGLTVEEENSTPRELVMSRALSKLLSRRLIKDTESALMAILNESSASPAELKAIAAGLFCIEFHRKSPETLSTNPIWDIIFELSSDEALATAGDSLQLPENAEDGETKTPLPDSTRRWDIDIDESLQERMALAISHLESGKVELGFSLETILVGLRKYRKSADKLSPEELISELETSYFDEIGFRERDDLLWGLSYAVDRSSGKRKEAFKTVQESIAMLPVNENPVMFALYYKCVVEFYRFLKSGEVDLAKAILDEPDSIIPILEYARYLLNNEAPRRSLKAFEVVLRMDPESAIAEWGAGIALWVTESHREARMHWHRAERHWQNDAEKLKLCSELVALEDYDPLPDSVKKMFSEPFVLGS